MAGVLNALWGYVSVACTSSGFHHNRPLEYTTLRNTLHCKTTYIQQHRGTFPYPPLYRTEYIFFLPSLWARARAATKTSREVPSRDQAMTAINRILGCLRALENPQGSPQIKSLHRRTGVGDGRQCLGRARTPEQHHLVLPFRSHL
jgi:hypothetical protein